MPAGYITPASAGGLLRSARRWRDIFRPRGAAASTEARPTRRRFDCVGEGGGRRRGGRASGPSRHRVRSPSNYSNYNRNRTFFFTATAHCCGDREARTSDLSTFLYSAPVIFICCIISGLSICEATFYLLFCCELIDTDRNKLDDGHIEWLVNAYGKGVWRLNTAIIKSIQRPKMSLIRRTLRARRTSRKR